jgi:hypothetical protein
MMKATVRNGRTFIEKANENGNKQKEGKSLRKTT